MFKKSAPKNTSWSPVAKWYGDIVGSDGHYFHEHIILPNLRPILRPETNQSVLDVGCGQGVYARVLPRGVIYTGVDISSELVKEAESLDKNKEHKYFVADATKSLPVSVDSFDHAISILAIQNMVDGAAAIANIIKSLKIGGDLTLVLNHPAYRIPRQSSWGSDPQNKLEYRRINRYLSPLEIPITAHPGQPNSPVTWTYHNPISYFTQAMTNNGCAITHLEEWASDKKSVGKAARAENRARAEFPLFLTIQAIRQSV